ncbi:3-oxoacyl-ACP synthase III family protein [Robertkochia aurantiaca]|uniref:3-oxoacyl-ACP synthase III family protein n=1 Tax=Robertkochia aurantiaca TaxID=2873700 RepID=UPI001CCF5745|nr:ketoacyl-ACP synthase III [Robertkochia sp. 3YJGBD-33]
MSIHITGTGSYIPSVVEKNVQFEHHNFLNTDGTSIEHPNQVIIEKFKSITGIEERRYAAEHISTSDMAFYAAEKALENAGTDPETLDYIIVAHNFGDIKSGTNQSDMLPSLAARVKHNLRIKNTSCVAYDLIFGCPGWLEGMIQGYAFIQAGLAKKCLVIGAETLSRVVDPHDRDSMIYADGAGATVIEALENQESKGIITSESASFTLDEAQLLFYGKSNNPEDVTAARYIKMYGRKIYEFAVTHVPQAMKSCLDKSGYPIEKLRKVFIHQANEKMDEAIIKRFYRLYNMKVPADVMPMNINKMGNSSVATIPTLFDMVKKGDLKGHEVKKGDLIMFASVGAGMNINAMIYEV